METRPPRKFGWVPRAAVAALALGVGGVMVAAIRSNQKGRAGREEEEPGTIAVRNAGLVLFTPFLPRFFERLGLLTVDEEAGTRIEGYENASRAVHLLQYLVDERLDTPAGELALAKLLCGLDPATPIAASIVPHDPDLFLCDELTRAVIANWPMLHNSSPEGLRDAFLQRPGRLRRDEVGWSLAVERKSIDVLVDQIPWSFSMIAHPWMLTPLRVTW